MANDKQKELTAFQMDPLKGHLTTDQGLKVSDTQNSLKAGTRGSTLLEDFHLREKMTHFDHERIPERVVHARGAAAHGYFQVYEDLSDLTQAQFLRDTSIKTPVFVRFSTVGGSRGSADTVRDVRGFATKFYTSEGNFDLVGNNIPVFFIQDGIQFPDVVHAVKPEPHHEIPQASTAHDTFWDFISLVPESMHMVMWILSDRTIPRSYRTMEGFGVHTFRLLSEKGSSTLVKFHWKPKLGVHSLVWDEALKLGGMDPDFHRRDLFESIENGNFPEYEFGIQVLDEKKLMSMGIDILDPTKVFPEEEFPVRKVGKLVLNQNPTNYFAETEQVAFHVGNLVPGIDVTPDPLLQARLFSYLDTQLTRLGGPNFAEIPINRPIAPVQNFQQDGFMRQKIAKGRVNYFPNSLGGGCPFLASASQGGYSHYPEPLEGHKTRERSPSFSDHYSQARLFWNSLSEPERMHVIQAACFELGKVETLHIQEKMVGHFAKVDSRLATEVAQSLGIDAPSSSLALTSSLKSQALSMENTPKDSIQGRKCAILIEDGFDVTHVLELEALLKKEGALGLLISSSLREIKSSSGQKRKPHFTFLTAGSVLFDSVFVPGGAQSAGSLSQKGQAIHFIQEAYGHHKTLGFLGEAKAILNQTRIDPLTFDQPEQGVVSDKAGEKLTESLKKFIVLMKQHRHWSRKTGHIPL